MFCSFILTAAQSVLILVFISLMWHRSDVFISVSTASCCTHSHFIKPEPRGFYEGVQEFFFLFLPCYTPPQPGPCHLQHTFFCKSWSGFLQYVCRVLWFSVCTDSCGRKLWTGFRLNLHDKKQFKFSFNPKAAHLTVVPPDINLTVSVVGEIKGPMLMIYSTWSEGVSAFRACPNPLLLF